MNTPLNPPTRCPTCGKALPQGAPSGLCPACLLAQGAETEPAGPEPRTRFEPPSLETVAALFPQLEIISLLGAGGMGAVYKARQPALDRFVALKLLPEDGADAGRFSERFNREARALAKLGHPNIVAVHEFGQAGGLHYFLMEFVDGANLHQLARAGRISAREALQIIPQICDALQYAHDEGVVHRDIKPENVLVDRKGRVKIADFGLAKIMGQDRGTSRLTVEGQVMGTPHYMAPEQVERPLAVDHRADIYALGVVFYEMLTGDLPIGKFQPPSKKVQVDVRFDEVVLRALENDPDRRYQHVSEVKTEVENIAGSEPQPAPATDEQTIHWAGFPLVSVRSGVRKVNKKERIRAWAIIFGLLTIVFAFVSAIAGRSLMGWLGIQGGPSLVVRVVLAAVIVGLGVRRAMRGNPEDLRPRAAGGTVILQPGTPWWRRGRVVAASIAVVVVTWTVFQEQSSLLGLFKSGFNGAKARLGGSTVAQVAMRTPGNGELVAKLPGGGRVELLAVSGERAAPEGRWRPDGSPLTGAAFTLDSLVHVTGRNATTNLDFIFRLAELPPGADGAYIEFEGSDVNASGGEVLRDQLPLPGAWPFRVALPRKALTTTARVGLGLEAWQTIASHSPLRQSSSQMKQAGQPRWEIAFQHAADRDGAAQVSVQFGPWDNRWQVRVIAVDTTGAPHAQADWTGSALKNHYARTFTFRNLPLSDVKEFQMQARPVHVVEFRNIALRANARRSP